MNVHVCYLCVCVCVGVGVSVCWHVGCGFMLWSANYPLIVYEDYGW